MKKYIALILMVIIIGACSGGGDDGGEQSIVPAVAKLIFPDNNTECNEGTNITATQSTVEFRWEESDNTVSYEVILTDLITGMEVSTEALENDINITIKRGTPYSWYVVSTSSTGDEATSDTWKFYNSGDGISSYAPFPATIVSPSADALVTGTSIALEWSGTDVDNDIEKYIIYRGTESDNLSEVGQVESPITSITIDVSSGNTYYWKVICVDSKGNTSESSISKFEVNP